MVMLTCFRETASGMLLDRMRTEIAQTNPIIFCQVPLTHIRSGESRSSFLSSLGSVSLDFGSSHLEFTKEATGETPHHRTLDRISGKPTEVAIADYPPVHEGAHEERRAGVIDYLLDDPQNYLPSKSHLETLKAEVMKEILFAVRNLLEATKTDYEKAPDLYASLSSIQFFNVCKRVYGIGRKQDLLNTAEDLLLSSPVTLRDFLRAMIAAAVNEWVFDGQYGSLPTGLDDTSCVLTIYQSEILKGELLRTMLWAEPRLIFNLNSSIS